MVDLSEFFKYHVLAHVSSLLQKSSKISHSCWNTNQHAIVQADGVLTRVFFFQEEKMNVGGKFSGCGIVFLGPPGCGKGTQARILTSGRAAHLSSGAILSEDSRTRDIVAARQLVPDQLYFSVMADHVRKALEGRHPVILDGLVRTAHQVPWLLGLMNESDYRLGVLDFSIEDYGLLIPRLLDRASTEVRIDDAGLAGCHQRIGEYIVNITTLRRELNRLSIPSQLINAELPKERVAEDILLALQSLF